MVDERKISAPVRHGEFAMPGAVQELFKLYQGDAGELAQERLLLMTAKRRLAEEKLDKKAGPGSVPLIVVEEAAQEFSNFLSRLASDLYNSGVPLDESGRAAVERLSQRVKQDFHTRVRLWVDRQKELLAEQAAKEVA